MTDVTPLVQPPVEDLRNALQIAVCQCVPPHSERERDMALAFVDVARLIQHALAQLGEPNEAAIQTAYALIFGSHEATPESLRVARDEAAAILDAQLRGAPPPQHPHEGP